MHGPSGWSSSHANLASQTEWDLRYHTSCLVFEKDWKKKFRVCCCSQQNLTYFSAFARENLNLETETKFSQKIMPMISHPANINVTHLSKLIVDFSSFTKMIFFWLKTGRNETKGKLCKLNGSEVYNAINIARGCFYFFIRKLFHSTRLYTKGILDGWPETQKKACYYVSTISEIHCFKL